MQKKKAVLIAVAVVFLLVSIITPVSADTTSNVKVTVNNQGISGSTSPVYQNDVVLVPAKEFVEALGGSFSYNYDSMTGTILLGENELVFKLDDSTAKFDGKYLQAPAPMKIAENRFMVPAEFVARTLGCDVYRNALKNLMMVFQPVNGKLVYQVMSGDSLWTISQLFGTSISAILQLNNLTTSTIYVGQKLVIKNMTALSPVLAAMTTGSATLRSGPGFSYTALNYLSAYTSINVTGKNGDWYKVVTPKGNGYIYYSVVGMNQDTQDTTAKSTYFDNQIPVDTSADSVTYSTYAVPKGGTIWSIALSSGIPDYELAAVNNLTLSSSLSIGQILQIPIHIVPVKATQGPQYGEVLDWFKEAQYVFPIGKTGKFIDIQTGKSFMAKRTMGASHSDTETLTPQDTQVMKDIFGGSWTWNRRPFILEVDGRHIAVSIAGMPHAGVDGAPYLQNVYNRSGNYGYGPNDDSIAGNGMDGHFDVYFLNSLRHVDNKLDPYHQYYVLSAGGLR